MGSMLKAHAHARMLHNKVFIEYMLETVMLNPLCARLFFRTANTSGSRRCSTQISSTTWTPPRSHCSSLPSRPTRPSPPRATRTCIRASKAPRTALRRRSTRRVSHCLFRATEEVVTPAYHRDATIPTRVCARGSVDDRRRSRRSSARSCRQSRSTLENEAAATPKDTRRQTPKDARRRAPKDTSLTHRCL